MPRRSTAAIASLMFAIPLIVAAVSIAGQRYVPMGDEAAILFQSQQVGTLRTPLVGVYSTHGWAHPGPFLFYLLAIPLRLTGRNTVAPFVFAAVCNGFCVILSCALAWRRRGWLGLALVGAGLALLIHGLGTDKLVRVWNPYVPLLLYFAFLLTMWGVAERDHRMLPLGVALASAVVQMHVGYLPLVILAAASAGVHLWLTRKQQMSGPTVTRSSNRVTIVIVGLFWLTPLLDLAFGSRNVLRIIDYFGSPHTAIAGLGTGLALMNRHVGPTASWASGQEPALFHTGTVGVPWQFLGFTGLLISLAWLQLRRPGRGAALPLLALGQLVAGSFAASKVELPINSYLVVWMLPLAAFCWTALAVSLTDIAGKRTKILSRAFLATGLLVALSTTLVDAFTGSTTPLPQQQYATPVLSIGQQLRRILNPRPAIRVEVLNGAGGRPGDGVLYAISQLDHRFYTSDGAAGQKWGIAHRWHGQGTDYALTIVATDNTPPDAATQKCLKDKNQQRIAAWSYLSPRLQAEKRLLLTASRSTVRPFSPTMARRLTTLTKESFTLEVFRGRDVCGTQA